MKRYIITDPCSNRDWTRVKITDGASVYMSEECDCEDDY